MVTIEIIILIHNSDHLYFYFDTNFNLVHLKPIKLCISYNL